FRLYGFTALIIGIILPIVSKLQRMEISSMDLASILISIIGLLMLTYSSGKFRRFLLGKDDDPKRK
ncbi:MAG: hypothetical protein K2O91_00650, partial [Lachnospiraceae bacterium]|nr:hypothetical protein [Lachnospiraceae bacterium]